MRALVGLSNLTALGIFSFLTCNILLILNVARFPLSLYHIAFDLQPAAGKGKEIFFDSLQ